ncbi:MAG: hypothetical protein HYX40_10850 [Sphingobacteriales bacterium]|nr:hypothetical protein [Sphingobacteriales bacterium]
MKNRTRILSLLALLFFAINPIFSQDIIRQQECDDTGLKHQADSLKNVLTNNGFIIVREASMTMESEYEMPVIVPLTEGSWYQVVFIGDPSSKLNEVRMYDYDEKQVYYQKNYGDIQGNIISYGYISKFSEYHMIKPVQVNKKKKTLCGYIMLLKRVK